jgi:hypothetical protein
MITLTMDEYLEYSEQNAGFCLECRSDVFGIEPDARNYICEECGEPQVFGIQKLLLMGNVIIR